MTEKFRLRVKTHFDAAHSLENYSGKCARLHGHRWEVEFVFEGSRLDSQNMLVDFAVVKRLVNRLTERLDHHHLNEELKERHPTAEFLARWLYTTVSARLESASALLPADRIESGLLEALRRGVWLTHVTVWEAPGSCVTYARED